MSKWAQQRGGGNTRTAATTQPAFCLAGRHQGPRGPGVGERGLTANRGGSTSQNLCPDSHRARSLTSSEQPSLTASPKSPPTCSTLYSLHSSRDLPRLHLSMSASRLKWKLTRAVSSPAPSLVPRSRPSMQAALHCRLRTGAHTGSVLGARNSQQSELQNVAPISSVKESEAHSRQFPVHLVSLPPLYLPEPFPFSLCFQRKAKNPLLLLEANLHPALVFPGTRLPATSLLSPRWPSDRGQSPRVA